MRICALFAILAIASVGWSQTSSTGSGILFDTPPVFLNQGLDPSIHQELVPYTPAAQPVAEPGVIIVAAIVNLRGQVMNVHVIHGIGLGLDEKAVQAVMLDRFNPALKDGKPISVAVNIKVTFLHADK